MGDVIAEMGHLFLGSRLKRLAERFQQDASAVFAAAGVPVQPPQMALLAAVDRYGAMTVSGAVEALGLSQPAVTRSLNALTAAGLVTTTRAHVDQRHKTILPTPAGTALLARCKAELWPRIDGAVAAMCAGLDGSFLEEIGMLEDQLAQASLPARIAIRQAQDAGLSIVDYTDAHAEAFYRISAEWIEATFALEDHDHHVLGHPREAIIAPGGIIRMVQAADGEIIGACALIKTGDGAFELTKMGVTPAARGKKAGEFLLRHMIDEAKRMRIARFYLLTNRKAAAAIHLYEKLGFVHDADIMRDYGSTYARCDVAMSYAMPSYPMPSYPVA